ncbi:MAG: hypothetical protein R3B72_16740 [Polyangiaceae bacterium]
MPHRDPVADPGVEGVAGDVDQGEVLDIGAAAHGDAAHVTAKHGAEPDAGALAHADLADDGGGGREVDVLGEIGALPFEGQDEAHWAPPSTGRARRPRGA